MERRTRFNSLRGARMYLFIIAVISLSLLASLFHSRPAHAEDFLRKTVQCVVGVLFREDCQQNTPTPHIETAPASDPAASQPSTTSSSSSAVATPQPPTTVSPAQVNSQVVRMTPIDTQLAAHELPSWSRAAYDGVALTDSLPYGLAYGLADGVSANSEPLEATREGWRILGILWYWWAAGIAAMVGVGLWVKKKFITRLVITA